MMHWKSFLFAALTIALSACSPESAEKYHTADSQEEIISLFNEGQYGKAIWLIESQHGKVPNDPEITFLLGQAYLGKAGIEPIAFGAKISGAQKENNSLFSNCPNSPQSIKNIEPKCILKRIHAQAPSADSVEFKKARELFRIAYPNPSLSPEWVNTNIGLVETISLVKRVGDIYIYAKTRSSNKFSSENDLIWLKAQGKEAYFEATQSLARAEYAGEKISQLLSGAKENIWFQRGKEGVEYIERMGLPAFIQFARDNLISAADEIRYGELIDKLQELVQEEENK